MAYFKISGVICPDLNISFDDILNFFKGTDYPEGIEILLQEISAYSKENKIYNVYLYDRGGRIEAQIETNLWNSLWKNYFEKLMGGEVKGTNMLTTLIPSADKMNPTERNLARQCVTLKSQLQNERDASARSIEQSKKLLEDRLKEFREGSLNHQKELDKVHVHYQTVFQDFNNNFAIEKEKLVRDLESSREIIHELELMNSFYVKKLEEKSKAESKEIKE